MQVVHGEATRPRMLFSSTALDFGTQVVSAHTKPMVEEISVRNVDDYPTLWKIDLVSFFAADGIIGHWRAAPFRAV